MERHVKIMLIAPLAVIAGISMLPVVGKSGPDMQDPAANHIASENSSSSGPILSKRVPSSSEEAQSGVAGATILEQAILDAFPERQSSKAADKKSANAADFLAAAINSAGHLCDHPLEARKADESHYGIACRTHSVGDGRSNYLINVRSGTVDAI